MSDIKRVQEFDTGVEERPGPHAPELGRRRGPMFTLPDAMAGLLVLILIWGPLAAGAFGH
jgi:hypothetical protein